MQANPPANKIILWLKDHLDISPHIEAHFSYKEQTIGLSRGGGGRDFGKNVLQHPKGIKKNSQLNKLYFVHCFLTGKNFALLINGEGGGVLALTISSSPPKDTSSPKAPHNTAA